MPYQIKKNKNGSYRVVNKENNTIKARHTTKTKAEKQVRLLEYIVHTKEKPNKMN